MSNDAPLLTASKIITLVSGAVFGAVGAIVIFKGHDKIAVGAIGALSGLAVTYVVNIKDWK